MSSAENMLADIICKTFQKEFKNGATMGNTRGMMVTFDLPHRYEEEWHDDYYPEAEVLIWSPSNYTKVFVRESNPHHVVKGIQDGREAKAGPWVKISDHDSGWREGVMEFVRTYAEGARLGVFDWYDEVAVARDDMPTEWGRIKDAEFLPDIRRNPGQSSGQVDS